MCPASPVTMNFMTSGTTPTPGAPGNGAGALLIRRISVPGAYVAKSMTTSARSPPAMRELA